MRGIEAQSIIRTPTDSAIFLVLTIDEGSEAAVRDVLANVNGLRRSVGFRLPEGELTCITGIGADAWDRLFGSPRPAGLHRLPELTGPVHRAVSTPGDLLFHIRARRQDLCFELAQRLTEALADAAQMIDEVHGFRSFDERDLLGFVDGTENPEGQAAVDAVLIGEEDSAFAGGSYVVVQKYTHDLTAWDALTTEQQELIIGRTKLSDLELADDLKPPDSHIALNVIEGDDGEELPILRFNMPFGEVGIREFGTYFIGYAGDPAVIEEMLRNMFLGTLEAAHDRILDFSTAVTGTLFFVPPIEMLDDPPEPRAPGEDPEPPSAPPAADGSLGIGSLRPPLRGVD
jgi:putative iron-dependent peroxidase